MVAATAELGPRHEHQQEVISRIMHDLGISDTSFARVVLRVAVLEDIVLPSFTPALRHIHRALRARTPRHLAVDEAMGNAVAIAELLRAART